MEQRIEQGIWRIWPTVAKSWRVRLMIGGQPRSAKFATKDEAMDCRDRWLAEQTHERQLAADRARQQREQTKCTGDKTNHD